MHTVTNKSFICDHCGYNKEFKSIRSFNTIEPPPNISPVSLSPQELVPLQSQISPIISTRNGCCGGAKPSVFQKAKNFAHTMGDFAGSGFKLADEEVYNQRLEVCRGCDRFENNRFCRECGCFMDLKAKIEVAECPLDKWPK